MGLETVLYVGFKSDWKFLAGIGEILTAYSPIHSPMGRKAVM